MQLVAFTAMHCTSFGHNKSYSAQVYMTESGPYECSSYWGPIGGKETNSIPRVFENISLAMDWYNRVVQSKKNRGYVAVNVYPAGIDKVTILPVSNPEPVRIKSDIPWVLQDRVLDIED